MEITAVPERQTQQTVCVCVWVRTPPPSPNRRQRPKQKQEEEGGERMDDDVDDDVYGLIALSLSLLWHTMKSDCFRNWTRRYIQGLKGGSPRTRTHVRTQAGTDTDPIPSYRIHPLWSSYSQQERRQTDIHNKDRQKQKQNIKTFGGFPRSAQRGGRGSCVSNVSSVTASIIR